MRYSSGVRWTGLPLTVTSLLVQVDPDRADDEHGLARRPGASQRRAQPREQLPDRERLRHVVVGARVERRDLLVLVADGRDDDDRRVAPGAQLAADVGAAAVGQQEIEHDGVRRVQRGSAQRLGRGCGRLDVVAGAAEVRRERAQELRLVVDDEHAGAHAPIPAGKPRRGQRQAGDGAATARLDAQRTVVDAGEAARDREAETGARAHRLRPGRSRRPRSDGERARDDVDRPVENLSAFSITFTSTRWIWTSSTRRRRQTVSGSRHGDASAVAHFCDGAGDQLLDRPDCGMRRGRACLQAREVEQIADEPDQPIDLEADRLEQPGAVVGVEVELACSRGPSTAAAIDASGVRRSCETLWSTAVLIASDCSSRSRRCRSSASATSDDERGVETFHAPRLAAPSSSSVGTLE